MEILSAEEVLFATEGELVWGTLDAKVNSVSIDSRKVSEGTLFVPIHGQKINSHDFIEEVLKKGAKISLTEEERDFTGCVGTIIKVDNTILALQRLAKYYRNKFDVTVIGVTGSVGKTTTKEMIACGIGSNMEILKTEGNHNGQIGVPLTLLNLESKHQVAVIEMGISEIGEMERLADIANVDIGVVTNIGLSHIENFKNIETTRDEKLKLVKKPDGYYCLNGDNPMLMQVSEDLKDRVIYFGLNGKYAYKAEEISSSGGETTFVLVTDEFRDTVKIPCMGIHNVYNALAAITVAALLGIHLDDVKKGLMNYKGMAMRQQILKIGDITVIDDSYNASPDSAKGTIGILRNLESDGKNIVVMADMLELGEKSADLHHRLGRYIALEGVDVLITVGEMASYIAKGADEAGQQIIIEHCENNDEAFEKLINLLSPGDKVMVKGSRGMHTDVIVKKLKEKYKSYSV